MRKIIIQTFTVYGIRRKLIDVGSITEVKQRRARLIIGWVTSWDCQVLYTLGMMAKHSFYSFLLRIFESY